MSVFQKGPNTNWAVGPRSGALLLWPSAKYRNAIAVLLGQIINYYSSSSSNTKSK